MPLTLQTCATIADAEAAIAAGAARYLGGGTLAVRAANEGDLSFERLVRATDPRLSAIEVSGREVRLGASVTMTQVARHEGLSSVAIAARAVGGPAIRNMATIGGNLFAPVPYGDFAVALLALGASVETEDEVLDMDGFLMVRHELKRLVTGVRFKLPADGAFRFAKVARVKPKGVSVLSIGTMIETDASGRIVSARVALGCMNDRPLRAKNAEDALIGSRLTPDGVARAVEAVTDGVDPPTDPIASAWYRREVLPVHFRRMLLA